MKQFLRTFISEKIPRGLQRKITRGNVFIAGNDRCRFASEQNGLSLADGNMNGCNSKLLKVSSSHSYVNGSFARRFSSSDRPDPFARRPTPKCDPYGQSGKPLTFSEASSLLRTVDTEWRIMMQEDDDGHEHDGYDENCIPFAITRDFFARRLHARSEIFHSCCCSGSDERAAFPSSSCLKPEARISQKIMEDFYPGSLPDSRFTRIVPPRLLSSYFNRHRDPATGNKRID